MRIILIFILSFLSFVLKAHDSTQINQSVRAFVQMVKNNEKKAPKERNYHFLFSGIEVDKTNFLAKEYINGGQEMFVVDDNYNNALQKIKDFNTYQSSQNRKKAFYVFHGRYFLDYWGSRDVEDKDIEVKIKGSKEKNFYKALKNTQGVKNLSKKVVSARKNELIKRIYNELKKEQVNTEEFIIAFVVEEYHAYYDKLELGKTIDDVEPKIKVRSSWWYQYLDVKKSTSLNLGGRKIKIRNASLDIDDKESVGITPFTPERGASAVYSKALFELVSEIANPSYREQIFDQLANLADFLKHWQEYINSIKNLEKEQKKQKLIDDRNKLERLLSKYRGRTGAIIIRGMGTGNYEIVENGNTDLETIDLPEIAKRSFSGGIQDWYNALQYYFDTTNKELAKYNDNPCRFCPPEKPITIEACQKMEELYTKGGGNDIAEEALKKLCEEIPRWGDICYINGGTQGSWCYMDCLNSFSDAELTEFFKQVYSFTSEQVKKLEGNSSTDCNKFEEIKNNPHNLTAEFLNVTKNKVNANNIPETRELISVKMYLSQRQTEYTIKILNNGNIEVRNKGTIVEYDMIAFVITENEEILVGKYHYSLMDNNRNKKILGAGAFIFRNGQIIAISNLSGHYQPTKQQGYQAYKILSRKGINLQNTFDHTVDFTDTDGFDEAEKIEDIWIRQLTEWTKK